MDIIRIQVPNSNTFKVWSEVPAKTLHMSWSDAVELARRASRLFGGITIRLSEGRASAKATDLNGHYIFQYKRQVFKRP